MIPGASMPCDGVEAVRHRWCGTGGRSRIPLRHRLEGVHWQLLLPYVELVPDKGFVVRALGSCRWKW